MRKSLLLGIIISLFIGNCNTLQAQTDTEFWFVAPEVSSNHGDEPILFRITTAEFASDISISMPANIIHFPTLNYYIEPYTTFTVNLTTLGLQNEVEHFYDFRDGISGKSNKGIHIQSTNPVTIYYEVLRTNNTDIFTLKGQNALGTEFFGIFQNVGYNMSYSSWSAPAYSALDIVSSEDNTTVTFESTHGQKFYGYGIGIFEVILDKGETLSLVPDWTTDTPIGNPPVCETGKYLNDYFGRSGKDRLSGVRISSDKNIAITKKDDSVRYSCIDNWTGGCYDLTGDQLVPTNMLGMEYIVMKGNLFAPEAISGSSSNAPENVYIVATEDNTGIFINGNPTPASTINTGETYVYELWNDTVEAAHIRGDKKISVLHITGFGCETGAAIIPSIDECKGSYEVNISRSTSEGFYLNIMVTSGSQDSIFVNGILQDGSTGTLFGPEDFHSVWGNSNWLVYRSDNIPDFPIETQTLFQNLKGLMHIGLINGGAVSGCRYGYFSNFSENRGSVITQGVSSASIKICESESIELQASGGFSYSWSPTDYLSDPNIPNPIALLPTGIHNYQVNISRPCYSDTTINIEIEVCENPTADFTINTNSGTSPLTINISNIDSAYNHKWYWDDNDLTAPDYETESNLSFTHTYLNSGNTVETKNLTLIVENEFGCSDTLIKEITINPETVSEYNYTQWFAVPYATGLHNPPREANISLIALDNSALTNIIITQPYNPNLDTISVTIDPTVSLTADIFLPQTDLLKIINNLYVQNALDPSPFIGNNAIKIESDREINGFYEYQRNKNNVDLFSFKGNDALGFDFWVPFQNDWKNHDFDSDPAFSQIVLTATTANTEVNVTFKNNAYGLPAGTYTFNLAEPGMTLMFVPSANSTDNYEPNYFAADRLVGTHITSNKPISVTIADDSVQKSVSYDLIGDQLVPVNNFVNEPTIGNEYIVKKGKLNDTDNNEKVYVLTTETNTNISYTIKGRTAINTYIETSGSQIDIDLLEANSDDFVYILTDKPVYVFHTSGFGSELGGAIVPPVNNNTGSFNVTFIRTKTQDFYLNIVTHLDALNSFEISIDNGPFFPFLNATDFEDVGFGDYYVLKDLSSLQNSLPVGVSIQLKNSKNVFSLGTINGALIGGGCSYGYFSDFSSKNPTLQILGYNSTLIQTCPDNEIQFKATGGTSYSWSPTLYLDDPTSDSPKAILTEGILSYSVTITRPVLGDTTLYAQVVVFEKSEALFNVNTTSGCSPLNIEFENLSTEANTFLIDWENDGIFDTPFDNTMNQTILHSFNNTTDHDTVYTILLKAWYSQTKCYDTYEKQIIVHPQISADFSIDQNEGCSPLNINITNNSTGEDSVLISYGDGTIEVIKNLTSVNHIYKNTGTNVDTNQIEFIAYNKFGCTDTIRTDVIVYPEVKANYTIDENNYEGCNSRTVTFTNTSNDGEHEASRYLWEFDDGTGMDTTNNTIDKFYNNTSTDDKTYNFRLTAGSVYGCTDDTTNSIDIYRAYANFTVDNNEGCSPLYVSLANISVGNQISAWNWDYGDEHTDNVEDPFPYSYFNASAINDTNKIVLEVTGTNGCSTRDSIEIVIYPQIIAIYNIEETSVTSCDSLIIDFNSSIINPDLATTAIYTWDFGDGDTSTDPDPMHVYKNLTSATPVSNIVNLHVETDQGCSSDTSSVVIVNPMVQAKTFIDQFEACSPLTIDVIAQDYIGINTYTWDYGDGIGSDNLQNPAPYVYPANQSYLAQPAGDNNYELILKVEDQTGLCIDRDTIDVTVYSETVADFNPQNITDCNPFTVNFTDNSSPNIESWKWDFGNGSSSLLQNPENTFVNSGSVTKIFNVKLDVTSDRGCTDSKINQVSVLPYIEADFEINFYEGCSSLNVLIQNTSNGNLTDTYQWFIDNIPVTGSPANNSNFNYTIDNSGLSIRNYEIKLIATNQNGCTSEKTDTISVYPGLITEIVDSSNGSCSGIGDGFISVSVLSGIPPYNYLWNTGETNSTITGITEGIYSVTVTDVNTCSTLDTIIISEIPQFSVNIESTDVSCYGAADGILAVTPAEGIKSYMWSTGTTNSFISNLSPGIYAVTVTNNEGCIYTESHNILEPDSISIITDSYTESLCPSQEGKIEISVYGGSPPYNYIWSSSENSQDIYNLDAGNYNISVIDINGCFSSKNYLIDSATSFNDEEICFVSIDPEVEMNRIIWEKTPNKEIEYYKVYRHHPNTDIYQSIALLPFSDGGYFIDSLANIQNETFKYKISSINKCAAESSISGFHKSLYLNTSNTSEIVMLEWEAYEIEFGNPDIIGYIIFKGSDPNTLNPIDTVSSNESDYLDNDPEALLTKFYYRIAGVKSSSCILDTNSEFNLIYSNLVITDINTNIYSLADESINLNIFPNPFKDEISIQYELYSKSNILIEVYDIIGKKVTTLKKNKEDIGFHKHSFNPKDCGYSSGIYYVKLIVNDQTISKKIIQIK